MHGWTPERRARQAQLIMSWRPWEGSTGPRSDAGKTVSSKNALRGDSGQLPRKLARLLKTQNSEMRRLCSPDCGNRFTSEAT